MDTAKPVYGNWISDRRVNSTFFSAALFAALAAAGFVLTGVLSRLLLIPGILFALIALLTLVSGVYFLSARKLFSYTGGNVQGKIVDLVVNKAKWSGEGSVLDIGCGSGRLAILLAKKYEKAHITGVDYWGGTWCYDKEQCERNASLENVNSRTDFLKASASKLPFADETFDAVVSNLVFHEVKDVSDKRECIREALRVLKKGGAFAFQDLFKLQPYFGTTDELLALVKSWGVKDVRFEDTSQSPFIPRSLKLPFMVGTLGMIYGTK